MRRARCFIAAAICVACLVWAAAPGLCQSKSDARRRGVERAVTLIDKANVLVMEGRCEEAIPILERITAENRRQVAANEMLAGCYIRTGRAAEAVALLERCVSDAPGHTSYLQNLGQAYLEIGRKEQAVETWRRLLGGDTKRPSMYGHVARMMQEAGLYEEAIVTLREGLSFKENVDRYAREMIRLERLVGRDVDAFRDALALLGQKPGMAEAELRSVSEIFKESKRQDSLIALVDSIVAAGNDRNGTLRVLKAVLLVEGARYDEAKGHLFGKDAERLREDQLYSIIVYMGKMQGAREDMRFASLNDGLMRMYLERFGTSNSAPGVMLMMALAKREAAKREGAAREGLLEEALALAGGVKRSGFGAPYFEQAAMLRARVLFEDLHKGADALGELENVKPRGRERAAEAADLRMRMLLASGDWEEAAAGLKRLSADPDTNVALCGRYGLGRLAFLAGRYEESVKMLSDLAEKHPASEWANDALELAMELKRASQGGPPGALVLYRAAVLAESRGEYAAAIDSLTALEGRFPESSLAPRAVFMRAGIEARAGEPDAARADYTKLAERWPVEDLAPRALELKAALSERRDRAEALAEYGLIMERYPDYPFMERVRGRYVELGKSAGAAPKEESK